MARIFITGSTDGLGRVAGEQPMAGGQAMIWASHPDPRGAQGAVSS